MLNFEFTAAGKFGNCRDLRQIEIENMFNAWPGKT
jgi:hypothetical protein